MKSTVSTWLQLLLRFGLGGLLAVGGFAKVLSFDWWRDLVVQMDLFPPSLEGPLAGMLPGIEVVAGLALLAGLLTRSAALLSALLQLVFAAVMTALLMKDAPQLCGCFGPGAEYPVDLWHLLGNVAQLLLSLLLFALPRHTWSLDHRLR